MKYAKYFYFFVVIFILLSLYFVFRSNIVEGHGGRGGGFNKNINNVIGKSNAGFAKDNELNYYRHHFIDPVGNDAGLPFVQN